jgi:transcriptional regulator of heat shock response
LEALLTILYFFGVFVMAYDLKLLALLDVVIDNYITKGEPVGSKFLHSQ